MVGPIFFCKYLELFYFYWSIITKNSVQFNNNLTRDI